MKNGPIVSAILGASFFAASEFLLMPVTIPAHLLSFVIGIGAYGAGNMLFSMEEEKQILDKQQNFYDLLNTAKKQNARIYSYMNKIEDPEIVEDVRRIYTTAGKIIDTIQRNPKKLNTIDNFFSYYLPVTAKLLAKYDEIENQRLTDSDSRKFMASSKSMIDKIAVSFDKQLSSLYRKDILDTDAEMKVFDTMLKTDGYTDIKDFDIK